MSVGWIVLIVLLIAAGVGVWLTRRPAPPSVPDAYSDDDTAWEDPIQPAPLHHPHSDQQEPRS